MDEKEIDIKQVYVILEKIIKEIDTSRDQLLDIVDAAREEYESLKSDLEMLKRDLEDVIKSVDQLTIKDRMVRKELADVSKAFDTFSEDDIKRAYEKASDVRIELSGVKKEEEMLKSRRSMLEISLKRSMKNIQNAESVVRQVSIAMSYLKGEILSAIEDMGAESMIIGVKVLEAQENERKRVSRDIHDGPAQQIASIVMKAEYCEKIMKRDFEKGMAELKALKEDTRTALREVRDIIQDLRPMSLDENGLNHTLEQYAIGFGKDNNIQVKSRIAKMVSPVESIIQVATFRIVQEIYNNIKKHAEASQVSMEVEYDASYLRLFILDNGKGFNLAETLDKLRQNQTSFGLLGLYERVEQLKGQIEILSAVGQGTTFVVKLPVNREVILNEQGKHTVES